MTYLTREKLKSRLRYCPDTGVFTSLVATGNLKVGSVAGGSNSCGYLKITINRVQYYSHRLAWLYMTGDFPQGQLDHINQIKTDNCWNNIRECTSSENAANRGKPKTNTSGYKGVSWHKGAGKWYVKITFRNKQIALGYFTCPKEAALVYEDKALELFGEFVGVK